MKLFAPAKLNLYLHITGRRQDGLHLLDTLIVFTDFCDVLTLSVADTLSLTVSGEFSPLLVNIPLEKNIVYRAAKCLKDRYHIQSGVHIHLEKRIPIGAGLGGGSSDAAAVLIGLNALWNIHADQKTLREIGLSLGADVPVCIAQKPALVRGIGEHIDPLDFSMEKTAALLIAPPLVLSTQLVYQTFHQQNRSFSEITHHTFSKDNSDHLIKNLSDNHNDLEYSAITLQPQIQMILNNLSEQAGCKLARMSGSGAACFALFASKNEAEDAQKRLLTIYPDFWSMVSQIV